MRVNKTVAIRTLDPEHLGQGERQAEWAGWCREPGTGEAGTTQVSSTLTLQRECRGRMCPPQTSVTKCQTQTRRPEFFCKVRWPLPWHEGLGRRQGGWELRTELHLSERETLDQDAGFGSQFCHFKLIDLGLIFFNIMPPCASVFPL